MRALFDSLSRHVFKVPSPPHDSSFSVRRILKKIFFNHDFLFDDFIQDGKDLSKHHLKAIKRTVIMMIGQHHYLSMPQGCINSLLSGRFSFLSSDEVNQKRTGTGLTDL